jgi:hypothetical protein
MIPHNCELSVHSSGRQLVKSNRKRLGGSFWFDNPIFGSYRIFDGHGNARWPFRKGHTGNFAGSAR